MCEERCSEGGVGQKALLSGSGSALWLGPTSTHLRSILCFSLQTRRRPKEAVMQASPYTSSPEKAAKAHA